MVSPKRVTGRAFSDVVVCAEQGMVDLVMDRPLPGGV